ncbi:ADP-ribose diphosphatase [Vibrio rumoiensis]|uniref:ADP-ribose pyrophosphatase n=1 Tax=Vibrio rumoiensis 1S-45 TaxID=1188252 RepID=A0A1E5E244_9VIBR|nr:ADP-ribose diphosphatase [Vibrio rumoiensis]OEF25482.1 ADP-ribose diphosphatase [Vibrio rumoiensis 1S-45]
MERFHTLKAKFQPQDVVIEKKEDLFNGFFKMVKYTFRHRMFSGGWSKPVEREMFDRGHASALLAYDPVTDEVVLIEQIRVGALEHKSPWQLEIIAGMNDEGELPEEVVRREAQEEAGIDVTHIEHITHYYPSSGACSETLDVFVGKVDASTATGVHGVEDENEDIQVHVINRAYAYQLVSSGEIENGATIIALLWLELHHQELKERWSQNQ